MAYKWHQSDTPPLGSARLRDVLDLGDSVACKDVEEVVFLLVPLWVEFVLAVAAGLQVFAGPPLVVLLPDERFVPQLVVS